MSDPRISVDDSVQSTADLKSEKTDKPFSISLGKSTRSVSSDENKSNISIKQFLDLLKTAYQINDNLEDLLLAKGMTDVVNWIKLKGLGSKPAPRSVSEASKTQMTGSEQPVEAPEEESHSVSSLESQLQDQLANVINEGVIDSVLPLMVPAQASVGEKPSRKSTVHKSGSVERMENINLRKKSSFQLTESSTNVEIHVCDEVKGAKKDFLCDQKLLTEQMGYFADVTKEQRLEDMDITVHCDIQVFEWLMKWTKRDEMLPGDEPVLEVNTAIPILVSASFLQMEPLVNECLHFCHKNMTDILKSSSSLSCLNDTILTRLAAMYTNTEVEAIKDRKDKIQSKLFCKLIQSLCEVESETLRGHYCTMARVYRCKHCRQLINPKFAGQIPCVPTCMALQFDGSLLNKHQRDPKWDINDYILGLYKNLKSWRKVYWRLWGACHFLYCTTCKKYFPVKQEAWCRYHPDVPQYFTVETQKPPLPVGRFPCCGERAYRFQILEDRSGCHFREHTIATGDIRDAAIAALLENMKAVVTVDPPKLVYTERLTRLIAREPTDPDDSKLEGLETFWWDGLEIVPPRPKLGLLSELEPKQIDDFLDETDNDSDDDPVRYDSTTSGSASPGSEESISIPHKIKKPKKKIPESKSHLWQVNQSTRSNQDIQRFYEEAAFKKMTAILNTKTKLTDTAKNQKTYKPGGIWVRLEAEWREKNMPAGNKSKNIQNGRHRMKTNRVI